MTQVIDRWYYGHIDADIGDHRLYLEDSICICCGVDLGGE
jgi:hypothetical protein